MTDKPVDHEEAERIIETAPKALIDKLPDGIAKRSAQRTLQTVADYVHEAIEQGEQVR